MQLRFVQVHVHRASMGKMAIWADFVAEQVRRAAVPCTDSFTPAAAEEPNTFDAFLSQWSHYTPLEALADMALEDDDSPTTRKRTFEGGALPRHKNPRLA